MAEVEPLKADITRRRGTTNNSSTQRKRSRRGQKYRARDARSNATPKQDRQLPAATKRAVWPAYASAVVLWLSFPPANLGFLGWLAPLGWLHFTQGESRLLRRDYFHLWLSGCVFWLAVLQGIRLAYWPLYLGWLALSLYLAIYIPLFVAATRGLRSRGLPLMVAAPSVWVGLELVRSYMLTGYAANSLAHTQAFYAIVIQIADQLGGYGISFLMMLTCAAVYRVWEAGSRLRRSESQGSEVANRVRPAVVGLSIATVLFVANLVYGWSRLREGASMRSDADPLLSVLLVQENTPSMFDSDAKALKQAWTRYLENTETLSRRFGTADLVVWPESTFTAGSPWVSPTVPASVPSELRELGMDRAFIEDWLRKAGSEFHYKTQLVLEAARAGAKASASSEDTSRPSDSGFPTDEQGENRSESDLAATRPYLLLGSDAWEITGEDLRRYNSALFIGSDGELVDRYDKMHLVMFGEYIPLGPLLQWLRDLFGISGVKSGAVPKCFAVDGTRISPNICFESMMPRVIRGQVRSLAVSGEAPDLLINVTNDSWFRGSSMLDHHLACSILCAVENRRPLLVAANTGLSAEINGSGQLLQVTERFATDGILAKPYADARWGLVQVAGYPLAWFCMLVSCLGFSDAWRFRTRKA